MTAGATIREYEPRDQEGVLALFTKYLGAWSSERSARRWHWQYHGARGCRKQESCIFVAEADGAIVGHIGAFPLPLRIGSERLEVLCPGGLVVEQGHRFAAFSLLEGLLSRGGIILGTGWSRAASRIFRFNGAVSLPLSEVRYVYPLRYRGATHRELRRRSPTALRWMANRWSAAVAAPILDLRHGRRSKPLPYPDRSADLRPIARFGEAYNELWRSAVRQFEVSLDKDAAYLNWRYMDCPTMSPFCLGYYDGRGELAGVVIACRRAHRDVTRRPCGEDGEITEIIVRDVDRQIIEQMVVSVMELLNREGVDAVAAMGLHVQFHPILEGLGFDRTECDWGTLFALSNAPEHPVASFLKDDLCYFTSGDGDHLFMPGL